MRGSSARRSSGSRGLELEVAVVHALQFDREAARRRSRGWRRQSRSCWRSWRARGPLGIAGTARKNLCIRGFTSALSIADNCGRIIAEPPPLHAFAGEPAAAERLRAERLSHRQASFVRAVSASSISRTTRRARPFAIKEYLPASLALRTEGAEVTHRRRGRTSPVFRHGLKCFFEEGRSLALISHPNVVRVENFFRANETVLHGDAVRARPHAAVPHPEEPRRVHRDLHPPRSSST